MLVGVAVVFATAVPAVASPAPIAAPAAAAPDDPFEATNRRAFAVHLKFDRWILAPLAKLYHVLTPGPIGRAIHNVLSNLSEPMIIANDLLQARIGRAAHDTLRLTANTTAGFLGLMDVAARGGLPHHDNDFGVTLGRWGVGPGPYLFVPVAGPSTVRDAIGIGVDVVLNPLNFLNYPQKAAVALSVQGMGGVDTLGRSEDQLHVLLADAADPYATLRSVYLQSRAADVSGEDQGPALPTIEEEPSATPEPAAPTAAGPPAAPTAPAEAPPAAPATPGPQSAIDQPDLDAPIITARDWRADASGAATPAA